MYIKQAGILVEFQPSVFPESVIHSEQVWTCLRGGAIVLYTGERGPVHTVLEAKTLHRALPAMDWMTDRHDWKHYLLHSVGGR